MSMPQNGKDIKLLDSVQGGAMKMWKGLEGKMYGGQNVWRAKCMESS